MYKMAYKWSATIFVPSISLWHIGHDAMPIFMYFILSHPLSYSMYKKYLTCWRALISFRKIVTLTRKSHVSKKYGYFYWIFTSFHKIVCIVFAMVVCVYAWLSLCVCVFLCFVIYKLSRRYYVIGEQFKRNVCSLSMSIRIQYQYISWL